MLEISTHRLQNRFFKKFSCILVLLKGASSFERRRCGFITQLIILFNGLSTANCSMYLMLAYLENTLNCIEYKWVFSSIYLVISHLFFMINIFFFDFCGFFVCVRASLLLLPSACHTTDMVVHCFTLCSHPIVLWTTLIVDQLLLLL